MRAKAGKKQSSKDASGKAAHSAGASLRRYNELALKKVLKALIFCTDMRIIPLCSYTTNEIWFCVYLLIH